MTKEWSYAMPRKSPFPIVLTDEQRAVLESKVRKYPSSYIDVVRANPGRCRWILTVRLCSMPPRVWRIRRLLSGSTPPSRSSVSGVNGSSSTAWKGCRRLLGEAGSLAFPPKWSSRSKPSPANCLGHRVYRCHGSAWPTSGMKLLDVDVLDRSQ